jgi:hypothetical protein
VSDFAFFFWPSLLLREPSVERKRREEKRKKTKLKRPPTPAKKKNKKTALLDNVPCTLVMVPVIEFLAFSNLGLPLPLLAWTLGFGACFGGNGTLIGASANIVSASILERSGYPMPYVAWLRRGVPITLLSVVVANAYLLLRYCLPGSTEYPPTPIV